MSEVVAQMRRAIGDDGANVTLARNLLAPVATHLSFASGGGGDLHRRCVLFDCAPPCARVDDVCAALAPKPGGGAIEAVTVCEHMAAAVVVFTTPAGAESALRGPARGSCHAVLLPLELGAEMPAVIRPTDVKIMSDSRIPGCATPLPAGGACTPPEGAAWMEFRDTSVPPEAYDGLVPPPRGTKRCRPSSESSMWMRGDMVAAGMRMESTETRYGPAGEPILRRRKSDGPEYWTRPLG
ncbi:unnamed protein product [Urochloa decumbens]|uniref:Uncharacterized protein n=1 Tax=Urochloa decumbens TaxID=240449 RepID=A0ABC9DX45_9POAL